MNKIPFKFLLLFLLVLILAVCFVQPAFAHGDEARLEISVERLNPGGMVEVRGVDFGFEETVMLALIGSGYELPLGEVTADTEGIFLQNVVLPTDLVEGVYYFRATTDDEHVVDSPQIIVLGTAVIEEEGEGRLDEEEGYGLLAPMPTIVPGAPTRLMAGAPTPAASTPVAASNSNYGIITFAVLIVIGTVVVIGVMRKRKS